MHPKRSIYAELYVKNSYRARFTPRVSRFWRPKTLAWRGPFAFTLDRHYYLDKWYKAKIKKPEIFPQMHLIDPKNYTKTLAQRLDRNLKMIDIGFKPRKLEKVVMVKTAQEMENLAIKNELEIDLETLPLSLRSIYNHFRIFEDLFVPGVYYNITQKMSVSYGNARVYVGNLLCPSLTATPPTVELESFNNPDAFNTLVMVNLDGNAFESPPSGPSSSALEPDSSQLVHWLVANVPDGRGIDEGETIVPYLQPVPFKGTGFHRVAFVLFRHKNKIDCAEYKVTGTHLSDRIFRMNRFFKSYESDLTPTATNFCQMKWHESCAETLKNCGMKVPYYHYEWNKPITPKQKEFPDSQMPFDLYFDMYRSRESINREMRVRRLETLVHKGKLEKSTYPDINYQEHRHTLPPWIHKRIIKENLGIGYHALLYNPEPINAAEQAEIEERNLPKSS